MASIGLDMFNSGFTSGKQTFTKLSEPHNIKIIECNTRYSNYKFDWHVTVFVTIMEPTPSGNIPINWDRHDSYQKERIQS